MTTATTHEIASEFDFTVTHLLATNTTPSPHYRNIVHKLISSFDEDISAAELDIAQLQKVLEARKADRDALIQRRASLAGVLSSLRQFPLEILGQIFLYASWDDPKSTISVSHVCQFWRQASLLNSDLWTSIRLGNRYQREYITSFIQRSRSRPMSLKYTGNSYNRYFEGVRNFLAEEGCDYQWKEIHVAISCQNNLPKLLSKSWDTLETLVLNLYWHSGAILLELESATRLTNLSVSHEIEFSVTYKIPPGLTHLSLNVAAPPKDVVAVLSQCANLEECVINHFFGIWPSEYGITKPPVYLPKLRKLHIRSPFAAKLVEMLKAPVLEDLLLHNGEFKLLHSLLNFIETHKSTLQKFVISMVSDDFISMLEGMENLKELRVFGNAQFEGYMLRALIFKGERVAVGSSGEDGTGEAEDEEAEAEEEVAEDEEAEHEEDEHYSGHAIHLPKLEVLHVICKTQSEIRKAFLEVVHSRSRSSEVARLKSVSLQIGENEQLKRQGFDVTTLDGPLNDEDADWVYGGRKNTDFLEW